MGACLCVAIKYIKLHINSSMGGGAGRARRVLTTAPRGSTMGPTSRWLLCGLCSLLSALGGPTPLSPSALLLFFEATSRGVFVLHFAACVLCRLPASQFLISNHASGVVARPRFLFKSCLREGRIKLHDLLRRLGRMFALFFCPRDEFLAA